jgi:hypothetical protein
MKDMNAREIHVDMNDTLGAGRIGYSSVTLSWKWMVLMKPGPAKDFAALSGKPRAQNLMMEDGFPKFAFNAHAFPAHGDPNRILLETMTSRSRKAGVHMKIVIQMDLSSHFAIAEQRLSPRVLRHATTSFLSRSAARGAPDAPRLEARLPGCANVDKHHVAH